MTIRHCCGLLLLAACACSSGEAHRAALDVPIPLDTVALVTLGGEGSPPLTGVVGATIADGRIVVANGGTHELLFYDQHGVLQRTVGGRAASRANVSSTGMEYKPR